MAKELLFSLTKKDFKIDYYRGSGPGGQHRNKTDTACRICHTESGAIGKCEEFKSQVQNRKNAFKRLTETSKFKIWHNRKVNEILSGKTLEEKVKEQMRHKNLKIEGKKDGNWQSIE